MKNKLTLLFIILIIAFNSLYSKEEFTISRLTIDFKGAVNYNGKIIVFGNSGDFIISNDLGETWERKHIFTDTVSIVNLVEFQGDLVGATTEGTVFRLDKNYNLIDTFSTFTGKGVTQIVKMTDTTLGITSNDFRFSIINKEFKDIYPFKGKTFGATSYNDIILGNNYEVILATDISLWFITPNTSKIKSINIVDYKYGQKIKEIFKIDNKLFVKIDNNVYTINDEKLELELFYNNIPEGKMLHMNNNYYLISKVEKTDKKIGTIMQSQFNNNKLERTSILNYERYISSNFEITNFLQINNSILVIGTKNTMFVSKDYGFTWDAISNFSPKNFHLWLNDSTGFWSNDRLQIFKTTNTGATFLPQKYTDTLLTILESYWFDYNTLFISQSGKGFSFFHYDAQDIPNDEKIINFMFTEDFGETFQSKWISGGHGKRTIYLSEGFNLTSCQFKGKIYFYENLRSSNKYTYLYYLDSNDLNIDSIKRLYYDSTVLKIIYCNNEYFYAYFQDNKGNYIAKTTDLEIWEEVVNLDKFSLTNKINQFQNGNYFHQIIDYASNSVFCLTYADTLFRKSISVDFSFNILDPNFKTYGEFSTLFLDLENNVFKIISRDTLDYSGVMTKENGEFIPNFKPGIIKKTLSTPFLFEDNNLYLQDWEYFDFNDNYKLDISKIAETNWYPEMEKLEKMDIRRYMNISKSATTPLYFQNVSSSKYVYDNFLLETNSFPSTKVEENVEKGDNYYYQYLSYPQPANEFVTTKIVTNNFECLIKENLKIFNSMGNDITIADDIEITKLSDYEYQLKWHCSNYPSGIYFIKTNCGNNQIIKLIKE